jgi:hypothetical protein
MLFSDNPDNRKRIASMRVLAEHPEVSTLVGSPQEVQAQLGNLQADHVLLVAFDHMKPNVFEALAENFANVASSMFEVLLERHDRESLERLAEVLVPRTPPPPACSRKQPCWCGRARPYWRAVIG